MLFQTLSECCYAVLQTIEPVNQFLNLINGGFYFRFYREAKRAISNFLCLGSNIVIITLGKEGAVFASAAEPRPVHVRPPKVEEVLDTTVR